MSVATFYFEGGVLTNYMQEKLANLFNHFDSPDTAVGAADWVGRVIALTYVEYEYEAEETRGGYVYFTDISRMRSTITAVTISANDSIELEIGGTWTFEIDANELRTEEYKATLRSLGQRNAKEYAVCNVRLLG